MSNIGGNPSLVQTGTLGLPFQLGIRQTFSYQRIENADDSFLFSTSLFYDVIFLRVSKNIDVAAGGNVGVFYGNTPLQWHAGPEVGFRWWIRKNAAVVGRVDYPFDLNRGRAVNVINYFIGFQVKLEKQTTK